MYLMDYTTDTVSWFLTYRYMNSQTYTFQDSEHSQTCILPQYYSSICIAAYVTGEYMVFSGVGMFQWCIVVVSE